MQPDQMAAAAYCAVDDQAEWHHTGSVTSPWMVRSRYSTVRSGFEAVQKPGGGDAGLRGCPELLPSGAARRSFGLA
jgi:hypothetical protein